MQTVQEQAKTWVAKLRLIQDCVKEELEQGIHFNDGPSMDINALPEPLQSEVRLLLSMPKS